MDRRDFIRTGAGAFFVTAAGSAFGAGAPSNRVRLAIVGCHAKGRGFSVMRTALKVPGVEIACVCDVDRRAREFAADYVLKATGRRPVMEKDLRKVLEFGDLDGIISETPDHFHAYSAVMAMKAGKAVYVEKPCCFCPEEGQILMRVARETGAVLQVGSQRRASVTYRAAFDYLRETNAIGEMRWAKAWYLANRESIGKGRKAAVPEWLDWDLWQGPAPREDFRDNIVHYNWHWFRKWGTSEMGNNAPHFADVSRWALGLDEFPESVQCAGGLQFPKGGDFEWPDVFNASFKYANGKMITFEMGCHNNVKPFMDVGTGALVYGERGALFLGPSDNAIVFDEKGAAIREWKAGGVVVGGNTPVSTTDPTTSLDVRHMTKFVDCIRAHDAKTNADAEQGVKSSVLPLLANIALDCGETIHLDPKTGLLRSKAGEIGWAREYEKGWELA
ncbi:MAG: Gfo/Idh/MocA family oxidoreductase [Kiritimatiellae bacterium]|nr:Gfo/Idh/MocA family oxidoreductase [Kiritimatiellia bacterium]